MNLSTRQQSMASQRGVALLVALLVVALATVLIAGLLDRGELTAARTRNQLRTAQAEAYAQGLEEYAATALRQDESNGNTDSASDIWAVPLPPTPVPGGEITATMTDLDGRFNLNNLASSNLQNALWTDKFRLLLTALKLDPNIADTVREWMSQDAGSAAGDAFYLAQPIPYRSSKNIFLHISELRLLRGISGDVYAQLAPHVSALPQPTTINVNTATVPVLMTLSPLVTQQMAQALWQQGHANYSDLNGLNANAPGLVIDCGIGTPPPGTKGPSQSQCPFYYGVTSNYFLARGQITLDGLPLVFYSLIERIQSGKQGDIHVIQRSRGADG
jgi:general secretion pathway protein K